MSDKIEPETIGSSTPGWKWLVIGLATVVIIGFVAAFPTIRSSVDIPAGINLFNSPSAGYSLEYPPEWAQLSGSELDRFQGFDFVARHQELGGVLSVRIERRAVSSAGLAALEAKLDESMASQFEGFVKHKAETTTISSGQPALRYQYTSQQAQEGLVRQEVMIVPVDDRVLYVVSWVPQRAYPELKNDVERALASFRVN